MFGVHYYDLEWQPANSEYDQQHNQHDDNLADKE